jgi:hypothetical protein
MKLLPKSPLDSSPLERGTGRGHSYFEASDPKQDLFAEKEQRERKRRKGETENPMHLLMETTLPAIQAEQVEDDVAPVTAEYVPAKGSDEELGVRETMTEKKSGGMGKAHRGETK